MFLSRSGPICFFVYQLILLMIPTDSAHYYTSCREIKTKNREAHSGEYKIMTRDQTLIRVYCEMGLHGGGYTFLHPSDLELLKDADIQHIFRDRASFLMRTRKTDGTQPYAIISQLSQYSSVPLMIGLNHNVNYNDPMNKASLGNPYLYFGFLPRNIANRAKAQQGMTVNYFANTYTNCDGSTNNYIALFPNFKEITPSNYALGSSFPFCTAIFSRHHLNPSRRVMPGEYFMFGEIHFGGCGCYSSLDRHPGVLSATIGFR